MTRGDIWWTDLGQPKGSEPGLRRPVLIVQCDAVNKSALKTVVVVVITSNLLLAELKGNVRLSQKNSGLPKASVANVSQILTINKSQLREKVGAVPGRILQRVDEGLKLILGLED
jgi:mRNA interferase MazF